MPAIEPFVPRRHDEPQPRSIRLRFLLAIIITVVLMIAAIAFLVWLPLV